MLAIQMKKIDPIESLNQIKSYSSAVDLKY